MALYVAMLTRPAYAALGKDDRVALLRQVFLGVGSEVPAVLTFGNDVSSSSLRKSVLGKPWASWKAHSLTGTLKRLSPALFSEVVFCLLSCAGMHVATDDASHDVVTTGLAYVVLLTPTEDKAAQRGHATFVEVST
jgi:hypothetical protein